MKKILGIAISLSMILFASTVYAADGDTFYVPGNYTKGTTAVGGGVITFTPSPSTSLEVATTAVAYNVTSWSDKNLDEDAGMQYLVSSAANGVYQKKLGEAATTVGVAGTIAAGDSWVPKK